VNPAEANSRQAALRQLRDLGFLVRSLVVVIAEVSLLAAFVYYCALAVTGGHDSGGMPATGGEVAFLALLTDPWVP
jgi:hypothetical protein